MEKEPSSFSFSDMLASTPGRILLGAGVVAGLLEPDVMLVVGAAAAAFKACQTWPAKESWLWAACSALAAFVLDPLTGVLVVMLAVVLAVGLPRKLARLEKQRQRGSDTRSADAINANREAQIRSAKAARALGLIDQAAQLSNTPVEVAAAPADARSEGTSTDVDGVNLDVEVPDTIDDLLGMWGDDA